MNGLAPEVVKVADVGRENLLVHDEEATKPTLAYSLSRMGPPDFPTPVGVLRCISKPVYDRSLMAQVKAAQEGSPPDLDTLYRLSESWAVPARDVGISRTSSPRRQQTVLPTSCPAESRSCPRTSGAS